MKINEVIDPNEVALPDIEFVYHGTPADPEDEDFSPEGLEQLKRGVVDLRFSGGGYFGYGFYVTETAALARSNYASRDGYVFQYRLDSRRVLDLRDAAAFDRWKASGFERLISDRRLPGIAVRQGIDGVYDRSMGGMCIYNPRVLTFVGFEGPLNPR